MSAGQGSGVERATFADTAFDVAADAFVAARGNWAEAVHATLTALFDFVATSPGPARECEKALQEGGAAALDRRERTLDRFARFLEPGYVEGSRHPAPVVAEAIVGGVYELVLAYIREDRVAAMSEAVPVATVIVLAPFVGDAEAERIAARPISCTVAPDAR